MIVGHVGKQPDHQGPHPVGHDAHQPPGLGHLHDPQPEGHGADQADGQGNRVLGRFERGAGEGVHPVGIGGGHRGQHNHGQPDNIDDRSFLLHAFPRLPWVKKRAPQGNQNPSQKARLYFSIFTQLLIQCSSIRSSLRHLYHGRRSTLPLAGTAGKE